jgi:hypothetical protein
MRYTDFITESADIDNFGKHIKSLADQHRTMDPDDPYYDAIDRLLTVTADLVANYQPLAENTVQPMNMPPASPVVEPETDPVTQPEPAASSQTIQPQPGKKPRQSGAVPNKDIIYTVGVAQLNSILKLYSEENPEQKQFAEKLADFAARIDTRKKVQQDPEMIRATRAAVAGIGLNVKAEIGKLDADVEKVALGFAERFNLPDIWARNLVGMFSTRITGEKKRKFLKACESGDALSLDRMIKKGEGSIDEVVNIDDPAIMNVYKDVKRTLLDISLSTGQRGATGPFEAMLAIMGGARKPRSDEGGDLVIERGKKSIKFEVKSGSLSPSSKLLKNGTLPNTGKATNAWLDSVEGKEISGSRLRREADMWLQEKTSLIKSGKFYSLWRGSDFRPGGIANLAQVLNFLDSKTPGKSKEFMAFTMLTVFPSLKNAPGYNFSEAIKRLVQAIKDMETSAVAKEQGIMAMIQYHLGKGNDGFIFFNSTTQEYKLVMGMKGILALANQKTSSQDPEELSMLRFTDTMTFSGDRCSPGVYYGPSAKSKRAKEYFAEFNSDPKRVKLRREAAAKERSNQGHEDEGFARVRKT